MRAIFMKHRPKASRSVQKGAGAVATRCSSPLVYLSSVNRYSVLSCPKNSNTAVAYAKGRLSALPVLPWDKDKRM